MPDKWVKDTVLVDMAENVAGDHLRAESITKVGAEIHGYEPTPGDLRTADEAELILANGLGLESWFETFVEPSSLLRRRVRMPAARPE